MNRKAESRKRGAIAVKAAIVMVVMMGMLALGVDVGYVAFTKTQLQAAADAATLAGGTELPAGLGFNPDDAATVAGAARPIAEAFAGKHPNGDQASTYADQYRDVEFGWAEYSSATGVWTKHWGEELPIVGGYNLIGVTLHRDQDGSSNADVPLPLTFARVIGNDVSKLAVDAAAVIMPAKGIRIIPGSDETANLMPFALRVKQWQKYLVAQEWYESAAGGDGVIPTLIDEVDGEVDNGYYVGPWYDPNGSGSVVMGSPDGVDDEPLFGHINQGSGNQDPEFVQEFFDDWSCACAADDATSSVESGSDGVLELDMYPRDDYTSGNFGTIDVGSTANETSQLERQILDGISEEDLSYYENNEFLVTAGHTTTGETGISAGIKDELDAIQGDCRAMVLFDGLTLNGNTATFQLDGLAGIRIMHSELTGSNEYKHLSVQRCDAVLPGAVGDYDEVIGEGTTVFTPLILID